MQSILSQLLPDILPVVIHVAALGLIAAIGFCVRAIQQKIHHDTVNSLLGRVQALAGMIVSELEQTMAKDLREAAADGKLDAGDAARLKAHAMEALGQHFGAKGLQELVAVLGYGDQKELGPLFSSAIESAVAGVSAANP